MRSRRSPSNRPKPFGRELRVGDFIQAELAELLRHKARDPRIQAHSISVLDVRVSRDLAFADVYISCAEIEDDKCAEEALMEALTNAAGFFRSEIASRHSMRTTPNLRFHFDRTESDAARIETLLAKLRSQ